MTLFMYKDIASRRKLGSSAISGKMLLVKNIENNKISAYFRLEIEKRQLQVECLCL